ncbi:hypothetical protein GOBAR_DD33089 [Gossypium barbadense]|nr:hypothetical protein GOBAR_DD33089 [Gossypium barbadense]
MEAVPIQSENFNLGFIGVGKMAESIARGVVQSGVLPPQRISTAIHSNPSRGTAFQSLGISVYSHNADVVDASDVIIFSVKPQVVGTFFSCFLFHCLCALPFFVFEVLELVIPFLQHMHAEAGNGQYEMALGYTACTYAADNLIFMREVVRAIANKHGLLATFVPKYALDDIGSGSHVHLSL